MGDIVGPGIYRFAFVWLASRDSNLQERRGDFLVSRIDDIDIRLHPQQKANPQTGLKEAFLVRGSWAALASSQGQFFQHVQPSVHIPGHLVGGRCLCAGGDMVLES